MPALVILPYASLRMTKGRIDNTGEGWLFKFRI